MPNPSGTDAETNNPLLEQEPTTDRPLFQSGVSSAKILPGESEVPFAPVAERRRPHTDQGSLLLAVLDGFRWRRPLMLVLAVAVAGSVMLAATRGGSFETAGRTSNAIADLGSDLGRQQSAPPPGRGEVGAGTTLPTDRQASDDDDQQAVEPLQVVASTAATSTMSTTASPQRSAPGEVAAGSTSGPTVSSSRSTVSSTSAAGPAASEGQSSTTSTNGLSTTNERTTVTQQTVTTPRPTTTTAPTTTTTAPTTTRPPTTRRPTTSVVLVNGESSGGFESPSIRSDMVWLANGEVGQWRSTNDDIQLMRSGFEGISSVDGGQFAELNSSSQGGLYRTLSVEPGTEIQWTFLHRARSGTEVVHVKIGPPGDLDRVQTVETGTRWQTYSGRWTVPDGQTSVRFMLWSMESGPYGNLVDAVQLVAHRD